MGLTTELHLAPSRKRGLHLEVRYTTVFAVAERMGGGGGGVGANVFLLHQ